MRPRTVLWTRHYYRYLEGEETSTNPMATIFAWSGAFKKRGELDALLSLIAYGEALEAASLETLNDGIMTKDLVGLCGRRQDNERQFRPVYRSHSGTACKTAWRLKMAFDGCGGRQYTNGESCVMKTSR